MTGEEGCGWPSSRSALGLGALIGYARHDLGRVTVIAARPHSFGGPSFAFRPYLSRAFGVPNLDASGARLCDLVDECASDDVVFFAHNGGPTGLRGAPRHLGLRLQAAGRRLRRRGSARCHRSRPSSGKARARGGGGPHAPASLGRAPWRGQGARRDGARRRGHALLERPPGFRASVAA